MNKDRLDLLHEADLQAQNMLTFDENNARALFSNLYEELLEQKRTPGLTNKDRKRIEEKAYSQIPGAREAEEKWMMFFENAKKGLFASYN